MSLIEIDGSQKSGSGTILRLSVALAAIKEESLHIYNIRQNRPQPGLKPQHLEAVLTAAKICDAELKNARLYSREIWFHPRKVKSGRFEARIGTAGSIPMLLATVLPICTIAEDPVYLHVFKGGTDVRYSPTINYMKYVFLPTLERMGLKTCLTIHSYGYYPKGMGEVTLKVEPCRSLRPVFLRDFGRIKAIRGVSVCTSLADRNVAERQAEAAKKRLKKQDYKADIEIINDRSNPVQKGSSIVLWTETDTGAIIAGDAIGEIRKTSETVGKEAAENLLSELSAKPTVDVHLADMLIPYLALAKGDSTFLTRTISDHLDTNIWLVEKLLNVSLQIEKIRGLYRVMKVD